MVVGTHIQAERTQIEALCFVEGVGQHDAGNTTALVGGVNGHIADVELVVADGVVNHGEDCQGI